VRRLLRGGLRLAEFEQLAGESGLRHAVSTRLGGVSPAPFDTLNLGLSAGDEPRNVEENRRRLADALGACPSELRSCHQVHGARMVRVEDQSADELRREHADVLLTNRRDRWLSLRFADCVPILAYDRRVRALALAHAGWRGTLAGAAGAAVRGLTDAFGSRPQDLLAAIGPSIGPCCYEVGDETAEQFLGRPRGVGRRPGGKTVLDLWALNADALSDAGVPVEQIEVARVCTRCHADEFFSHRAAGGGRSGRFALLGALA